MFQAQAVFLKGKVYVGGGNTGDHVTDSLVFEYHPHKDTWRPLPPLGTSFFGLCKLEGELVVVGGVLDTKVTAAVGVFDTFVKRWKGSLPPLDAPRHSPSCISIQSAVVVCGGVSPDGEQLSSIEVIKSDTFLWYTAGYLSRSATLCHPSAVAVHNAVYLLGGYKSSTANSSSRKVHSSSLDVLLSCAGMTPHAWSPLPATPHFQSTALRVGSCLLAVGGTSSPYSEPVHRTMHAYSHSAKAWVNVGELPYGFCHGTSVSLPNNEFYVMGGWIQPGRFKRSCKVFKGCVSTSIK